MRVFLFPAFLVFLVLSAAPAGAGSCWVFFTSAPGWTAGDPVPGDCAARVAAAGASVRTVSRYFHAVSADFDGDAAVLEAIPGVSAVRPVGMLRRSPRPAADAAVTEKPAVTAGSPYGLLSDEMTALDIPPLHDRGLSGSGILIGVLDSGFDALAATGCLAGITVTHARNFRTGGTDISGDDHGSLVLACIGGNLAGEYRAAAYGASFLLAVTENPDTETPVEEDYWVAGIEWCDSLGADIVSSSLAYNTFDDSVSVYDYARADMDGETSLVAQAAETAVSRGIVVVTAAGNERSLPWHIILTPGDAEHAITVGAVANWASGSPVLASFSSVGPTADGRIKPDVVAPGVSVSLPLLGTAGLYTSASGTSFATPLVSGLCALLLEAHPDWTPPDVMAALRSTALDLGIAGADTLYGYGLPDGLLAAGVAGVSEESAALPAVFSLGTPRPNPFNPSVTIPLTLAAAARVTAVVYDVTGRGVALLADGPFAAGGHALVWDAGESASGVYFLRVRSGGRTAARKLVLVK